MPDMCTPPTEIPVTTAATTAKIVASSGSTPNSKLRINCAHTPRKDLRMSLVAISGLALGIGACTVVFSVVDNSFFDALPYKNFRSSVVWQLHNSGNLGDKKIASPSLSRRFARSANRIMFFKASSDT